MTRGRVAAAAIAAAALGGSLLIGGSPADAAPMPAVGGSLATDGGTRVPCANDEPNPGTDPQGCVWDARHMGMGGGRSFVVRPSGRVVFVSHARAHYLLTGVIL